MTDAHDNIPASDLPTPGESTSGPLGLAPEVEARVREHFAGVPFLAHLGVTVTSLASGFCEMQLAVRPEMTQQHGYLHGGIIGTLADSASGHATLTLLPAGHGVITVEYKMNFLAPLGGSRAVIRARVVRHGQRLSVAEAQAFGFEGGSENHCATALVTYMVLPAA